MTDGHETPAELQAAVGSRLGGEAPWALGLGGE